MTVTVTEVFLSSVLGRPVINEFGKDMGKLWDLVMVPGEIFPEVSKLLVKGKDGIFAIPWREIYLFNPVVISIAAKSVSIEKFNSGEGEILVKRDILDRQIVDVNGAKVVRVNDLKLGTYKDRLCIFSADVGFRGILRRLGYEKLWERLYGVLNKQLPQNHISWEYVQPLEKNLSTLALTMARDQMADMHPADIANIISQIPSGSINTVLTSLDTETAGEAIHELQPDLRSRVISQLDSEHASDILEEMAPDEAADVLGDLPEEKAQELLGLMDAEEAEDIQELMEHEEDTAGGLMNSEFITIPEGLTVQEALRQVQELAPEIETVYYAYVLDKSEILQGVVSLRELLINPPETPVAEIMTTNLKTVETDSSPDEILEIIAKYNLIAVPVVDPDEKMAGVVTVDDIVELFLPYALRRRRHHHH